MFEQLEDMKRQYTDKYVVVDATRPELARFRDAVGRVKTVNMSGRALVEFDDYHLNIGWYDIDTEFLKVVDKPPPKAPKVEVKKTPAKAAVEAKPQAKAAPVAKSGKPSVADILAAARGGKAAAPAAPKAEAAPAEVKSQAAAPSTPVKVDRSKMSAADMIAAARGGSAAKPAAPAPVAKAQAKAAPVENEAADDTPTAGSAAPGKSVQRVDKTGMSIDQIVAMCRQRDAK